MQPCQLVAFYLPQYHQNPEASKWWGPGYTPWTTVVQGRPVFSEQYQPHVPADLGFYDLRLNETRLAQASLAARYGISAFCYFHYWFDGRRLYEKPMEAMLASGQPDFPFCICWSNEDVIRTWDGDGTGVLLSANYSPLDDEAHFKALLPAFTDQRYLKRDGCPIFVVKHTRNLPDARATARRWRELAKANGLPGLYLMRLESADDEVGDPGTLGFDAAIEYQPRLEAVDPEGLNARCGRSIRRLGIPWPARLRHQAVPYRRVVRAALQQHKAPYTRYPGVTPGWDNTPVMQWGGQALTGSTPAAYESWLRHTIARDQPEFVFINAWNDWANGCHLEPCRRWGRAYLEATRSGGGTIGTSGTSGTTGTTRTTGNAARESLVTTDR